MKEKTKDLILITIFLIVTHGWFNKFFPSEPDFLGLLVKYAIYIILLVCSVYIFIDLIKPSMRNK